MRYDTRRRERAKTRIHKREKTQRRVHAQVRGANTREKDKRRTDNLRKRLHACTPTRVRAYTRNRDDASMREYIRDARKTPPRTHANAHIRICEQRRRDAATTRAHKEALTPLRHYAYTQKFLRARFLRRYNAVSRQEPKNVKRQPPATSTRKFFVKEKSPPCTNHTRMRTHLSSVRLSSEFF